LFVSANQASRTKSSMTQNDIVIIVPTWLERRTVMSAFPGACRQRMFDLPAWKQSRTLILQCNVGPKCASRVAEWLQPLRLRGLWLLGVCGGLTDALKTGDVVLSDATVAAEGSRWDHSPADELVDQVRTSMARLRRQVMVGPVYSADQPLGTLAQKHAAAKSGALAVEMEAQPLAQWAVETGHPFAHLRVVLDPHDGVPLMWRRPAGFIRELAGFPFLRQMWVAGRSLRCLAAGLSIAAAGPAL
jgi:nucleoside phosphorylase